MRAGALVLEPEAGPSELGCGPGARGGRRAEPEREEEQLEERAGPALKRRRESVERDRPEGRLRARSAPGAHRAAGPAPSRGAACVCWGPRSSALEEVASGVGAGSVIAGEDGLEERVLDFFFKGCPGGLTLGGLVQSSLGDPGWGHGERGLRRAPAELRELWDTGGQDREREGEGRGLSAGLPGGLLSRSTSEEFRLQCRRRRGAGDVEAVDGGEDGDDRDDDGEESDGDDDDDDAAAAAAAAASAAAADDEDGDVDDDDEGPLAA